jgi:hypothetical protein
MRRTSQVAFILLLACAGTAVALAAQTGDTRVGFVGTVDKQIFLVAQEDNATSSDQFQAIPGLSKGGFLAQRHMTVGVSGEFSGGAVEVRVTAAGGEVLSPGPVTFEGAGAHSYTFGFRGPKSAFCNDVTVEWRSVTGAEITVQSGTTHVLYEKPETNKSCQ